MPQSIIPELRVATILLFSENHRLASQHLDGSHKSPGQPNGHARCSARLGTGILAEA
jgi:hypothetical protein